MIIFYNDFSLQSENEIIQLIRQMLRVYIGYIRLVCSIYFLNIQYIKSEVTIMDGHDSPRIGNNDIDYKPTKLLSAFLKGRVQ